MILLWILTKLRYRGTYIGFMARVSDSIFGSRCRIFARARVYNSTFGINSHVSVDAKVRNTDIGSGVGIAENAVVGIYNRKNQRVVIGDNVMIGTGAMVMEGVTIKSGAWIGAGVVVSRNVPKNAVVVGNPMQIIRIRPEDKERIIQMMG